MPSDWVVMGTSTLPAGTSIVTVDASSRHAIHTVLDGYDHAFPMVDPDLRKTFVSVLLPLIRPHVATVEHPSTVQRSTPSGTILAFGGGTVLDAAKLQAAESGLDWIAVPTKPTSAAFSATASVKEQGRVSTKVVSPPRFVLLLPEIICATPLSLLTAELFDTWSFQTAVADVILDAMANGREWNTDFTPLFNVATRTLAGLRPVDLRDPVVLERFMAAQGLLADVTNSERTTRYVSGAEHLIAHSLQVRGCPLPHGLQVGLGIAIGRILQRSRAALRTELRTCGFQNMPDPDWQRLRAWAASVLWSRRVELGLLDQALHGARSVRKAHRYTILDTASPRERRAALTGLLA
jgi:glycerol dehydrogenase-like iron-containing ADH family enzyme